MINLNTLKQLRQEKGVLQKDVASYLGVDRTTYVKYERGDSEPNHDILSKLADYFNVSIDRLLGREESKPTLDEQLDGVEFALFGEMKDMTDEQKQEILEFVKFKKQQNK